MIKNLISKSRSYRRFYQEEHIDFKTLRDLVDLGRLSPSSGNIQALKYFLSCDDDTNKSIFDNLSWADYLSDWPGPVDGERPSAYIIILWDSELSKSVRCDHGIAAQSILLGAVEKGLGGCILGSINRKRLQRDLSIPASFEILLVLALGKPKEKVVLEPVGAGRDIRYWRDDDGVHHVPKRSLDDIIVNRQHFTNQ